MDFGFNELSLYSQSDGTISSFGQSHLAEYYLTSHDTFKTDTDTARTQLQWTRNISLFARSGIPQLAIFAVSIVLTSFALVRQRRSSCEQGPKAPTIPWTYEILSQLSRATAVAFLAAAYMQGSAHLLNIIVLAYGFALGLLRLIGDIDWRHAALHQVNFVYSALLVVLFAGQFLPCIQIGQNCSRDVSVIGGLAALAVHFAIAAVTPREWKPPRVQEDLPANIVEQGPSPEEVCSWFTYYCSYAWLDGLIWKGTKKVLDMSGVHKLPWYDEPVLLLRKVKRARSISKTTLWTTLRFQRVELTLMSIWITLSYIVENVAPYSMFKLLDYLSAPDDATYKPWVWLLLVFIGPMLRSVLFQGYIFTSTRLLVRIKSAMTQELYHKALESMELEDDPFQKGAAAGGSDGKSHKTTSAGRLATLMAADIDAIFRARDVVMMVTGIPAGTAVSFYGMYRMMGWPSLVGTAVLLMATPISLWLGRLMFESQAKARRAQDSRLSLVTEYLASIRAIKYFAWESPITDRIDESRAREQKQLWRVSVFQAIINQVTQIFPFLALLVMFGLYAGVRQQRLEASVAFTTVFMVRNIRRNILQASYYMRAIASALVSFDRLDKYFESTVSKREHEMGPLRLQRAYFRRNKTATFRLEDISADFVEGGLNVVSGQSGSGKTTLLLAILGETYHEGGHITRPDDVAFASQSAWLQNDTVKANILFASPLDQVRYDRVIQACCLPIDLAELSNGDETIVGENGASLSGGQKARVALARALYSQAPVLLLDDIFSALDAKTAAGLWKYCFCSDLLKGRTTVLVTQVPWIPPQADLAMSLENGRVQSIEPNIGVVRRPITVAEVLGGDADDEDDTVTPVNGSETPGNGATSPTKTTQKSTPKNIIDQETQASGKINRLTFLKYMSYFGHPLFAITLIISLIIVGLLTYFSTYWLSVWVEAYNNQAHIDIAYYLGVYTALAMSEISVYAVVVIMFEWGAWRAARRLHQDFIRAVLRVDLSWFKSVPIGRITNRFAGDMTSIDSALSGLLRFALEAIVLLVFRLIAVSTIMPVFIIPALFTVLIGIILAEMYTRTAVVMKRLSSSSQSPIFSQFADTLAGLPVIRARAGMAQTFKQELADKMRTWSAVAESNMNCNRWVAVRVDFVTALVALCAGIIAVSKVGLVPAGLVGFSLSNANGLSQTILALVRAMNDLEVEMQSFHRVREYANLESEEKDDSPSRGEGAYTDSPSNVIPTAWPATGEIEFRNVTIRYSPDGPNILTDVNLKFKAGQRIAVVGRTGSGKSTLVLSLLRFTHIVSGQIFYSGIDITHLPRTRLRESLTIIPQEAVLFNGTVRSNLDPTSLIPDSILQSALDHCKSIASFSGDETTDNHHNQSGITLDTSVDARGDNFSHGQRQVLSLCRALIRKSRLMLLDEATASMDYETDRGLQAVLRQELESGEGRTLVTIAHRLRTIIDYDGVVVMSAGRVVEYGSPKELYDSKGLFYDMLRHSGEMEDLEGILEAEK